MGIVTIPAALGPVAFFANAIAPETGGSPNADNIHTLYVIVLIIALIVLIGVEGLLLYTVIRFRAKKHREAAQIHGNTRLEIGWTVGAGLIVVVLTVVAFVSLPGIQDPEKSGATVSLAGAQFASIDPPKVPGGTQLRIDVNGQQYVWRYTYPDGTYSYTQMVVPANQTVVLRIRGQDVAHSWWIPKLGGKFDAIPGYNNYTWFKASKVGAVYRGQCAELCGRNHANMLASVRVVSPPAFKAWLATKKAQINAANRASVQQAPLLSPLPARPGHP
jgi:cytochrome c oxidase subunit 2